MAAQTDNLGRTITRVRIGKPFPGNNIDLADPSDLRDVPIFKNEILDGIIAKGYDGIITLNSGEKFRVSVHRVLPNGLLLIQGKLHSNISRGRVTLVEFSRRFVEITFKASNSKGIKAAKGIKASYDMDFPPLH